ncbi:MAG: LiaF domain-containing protein [Eubacteriaceae bacterium]
MNKTINKSIIFGLILVAVGIIFAGNELGYWNINIFFRGWWTLFIIIPCILSIVQNGFNTGNIIGLCIGVFLLLQQQNMFYEYRKLIFPAGVIAIGLILILKQNERTHPRFENNAAAQNSAENVSNADNNVNNKEFRKTSDIIKMTAIFSGQNYEKNNETFNGADLTAIFGGVDLDIRNTTIEKDVRIDAFCLFGGMDIIVGQNMPVKVHSTCIFGGVDNWAQTDGSPAIHVYCTCIFGGIDIKFNKNKR